MSETRPRFGSLGLAGYGWSPADWLQVFYPDDLPEDWRISYYANEFNSVLLPANGWQTPLVEAAFWRSELGADFSYYLEINRNLLQSTNWPQVQEAIEHYLAEQVSGLLVDAAIASMLPDNWQERFPIHLLHPDKLLAEMPDGADAQTGLLKTSQALSPLDLRHVFEQMQQTAAHRDIILFLDTPWRAVEQIRLMQQVYGIWTGV